jgi:hypothetical protein
MAKINYNKGGDGGSSWQALPEGTYDVRILASEQGTSKAGNAQIKLSCEVLDGPSAGKKVNIWYSLLPQSTWKLDKLLETLDVERFETGEFGQDGTPILGFDDEDLIDRSVRYTVGQREFPAGSGKMTNDFNDESVSPFDTEEAAPTGTQGAQVPPPAAAAPAPVQPNLPGTVAARRRPRPAGTTP